MSYEPEGEQEAREICADWAMLFVERTNWPDTTTAADRARIASELTVMLRAFANMLAILIFGMCYERSSTPSRN